MEYLPLGRRHAPARAYGGATVTVSATDRLTGIKVTVEISAQPRGERLRDRPANGEHDKRPSAAASYGRTPC